MKFLAPFLFLIAIQFSGIAQDFKPVSKSESIKTSLEKKHTSTKTLTANFSEEIHSKMFTDPKKGTGKLSYKQDDKIRWDNVTQKQVILINGEKVKLFEKSKEVTNPTANKVVKKIQGMMLSMLSGEFLNEKDFKISYFESSKTYKLILTPKSDRIKKRIQKIELLFDKTSLLLDQMIMHESVDQKMIYTFDGIKTNESIADSKFNQL